MKELTQEKCHMSAKHARKDSSKFNISRDMKEFTQENCPMSARQVTKKSNQFYALNRHERIHIGKMPPSDTHSK